MRRYTQDFPCRVCGGWERLPRAAGIRCVGFLSTDGAYWHCTNEGFANGLKQHKSDGGLETWAHIASGRCKCGSVHGEDHGLRVVGGGKKNGAAASSSAAPPQTPQSVDPVRLPAANAAKSSARRELGPVIDSYDYLSLQGDVLYRVDRFHPPGEDKTFLQRRPDGRGGWISGAGAVSRVLYHLPDVVEAVEAGDTVYWVEGEKDVRALDDAGQVATTSVGGWGMRKYITAELVAPLAGADVVIVRDKDERGHQYADTVKEALAGVAKSVRVVEALKGKDAADHLAAGCSVEQFVPVEKPPSLIARAFAASGVARFRELPAPRQWIVENLIPFGPTGMLVAAGGTGKGHLIQQLGIALATGYSFGPFRVPRRRGVLYISLEDDATELHHRFHAALGAMWQGRVPERELEAIERYFHQVDLVGTGAQLDTPELVAMIAAKVREIPDCALVIIDPLMLVCPTLEHGINSQDGAGAVHKAANDIRNACGVGVLLVHHVNKAAKGAEMDQNAPTGSKLLVDLSRYVVSLRSLEEADITARGLDPFTQYLELAASKLNAGPLAAESAVWERKAGGGLRHVATAKRLSVDAERALEVLRDLGQATREVWDKACGKLVPTISEKRAKAARAALLESRRVTKTVQHTGGRGGRVERFAPADSPTDDQ